MSSRKRGELLRVMDAEVVEIKAVEIQDQRERLGSGIAISVYVLSPLLSSFAGKPATSRGVIVFSYSTDA